MKVNDMKARLLNLEETFKKHESELTELDRAIGDGDHGVNMVRGFSSLKDKLDDRLNAVIVQIYWYGIDVKCWRCIRTTVWL